MEQGGDGMVVAWEKLKNVSFLAAPMVGVAVSQYLLQVVAMVMVGHIDELSLSGVAIATSLTNVTGFSLLFGLANALETLCGQAYGAEQYHKLGSYTYTSIICLVLFCFPVCVLWFFMDKLLILAHQEPQISAVACIYAVWLIPALFGYAVLQCLVRYLQSQSLTLPLFLSSFAVLFLHVPLCWVMVYKFRFGVIGAALSIGIQYWLNVVLLFIYIRHSRSCEKTRVVVTEDVFFSMKEFISFAVPSAMMMCLEWWSFEILVLLSGLLPNSKLETSVLSICLTTSGLHYFLVNAIGAAASTHVSNELGAGNPEAARAAAMVSLVLAATDAAIVSISLFSLRRVWGHMYSNEREVVSYATEITPILCLSISIDSFLAVLSGIARGTGWQHIGAYANIGSYYIVGIPLGALLCFGMRLRTKGLWIGILTGSTIQTLLLGLVTGLTNWHNEAAKARERIFEMATWDGEGKEKGIGEDDAQKLIDNSSEHL